MMKKTEKLIITFHTTTDAMAMEQACKDAHQDGRLIPVPRLISAGCGLAWCADPESEKSLMQLMESCGLRFQSLQRCMV